MSLKNRIKERRKSYDSTSMSSADIQSAQNKSNLRGFDDENWSQGKIIEVINDPWYFQDKIAPHYIENDFLDLEPQEIRKAPINSLLVSIVGEKANKTLEIVVPFSATIVSNTPKVGETVWLLDVNADFKYWFTRAGGFRVSEDPNFTGVERVFTTPTEPPDEAKGKKKDEAGEESEVDHRPFRNFINESAQSIAAAVTKSRDKKKAEKGEKVEKKYRTIEERNIFQLAPVPRFIPRHGDTFIQGSNNTLIVLGTDRGEPYGTDIEALKGSSSANIQPKENSGTIDIVVGRGAGTSEPFESVDKKGKATGTMPRTILHQDGHEEIDKAPYAKNLTPNLREGDPLFEHDLSRIYVSSNTSVDSNFWPKEKYPPMYVEVSNDENSQGKSAIAMQTDQFRIYSKPEGEIRIVKQGNEETQALITLLPDGKVVISGSEIILGRKDENGEAESQYTSEPYVRYSELHNYINDFHSILEDLAKGLARNRSPGHFAPDVVIQQAANRFITAQNNLKEKFENIKSERIFGE